MVNHNHTSLDPHPNDCNELLALIPAYSIGATDADETLRVESLLPDCPEAIAELAEYMALSEVLLFSAPDKPRSHRIAVPPAPLSARSPARARFVWVNRLALAAAAIALIMTNVLWWGRTRDLNDQRQQLAVALADQEAKYAALGQQPPHHQELISTQSDTAHGFVVWDPDKQIGTLYAVGLSPLATNHVYQLWIAKPDHDVSLGVFKVDGAGTGTLVFKAPEPIINFDADGVSIEPAPGSPQPTTAMGILGQIERG